MGNHLVAPWAAARRIALRLDRLRCGTIRVAVESSVGRLVDLQWPTNQRDGALRIGMAYRRAIGASCLNVPEAGGARLLSYNYHMTFCTRSLIVAVALTAAFSAATAAQSRPPV